MKDVKEQKRNDNGEIIEMKQGQVIKIPKNADPGRGQADHPDGRAEAHQLRLDRFQGQPDRRVPLRVQRHAARRDDRLQRKGHPGHARVQDALKELRGLFQHQLSVSGRAAGRVHPAVYRKRLPAGAGLL